MSAAGVMRTVWAMAGVALVLSLVRGTFVHPQTATPVARDLPNWCAGGFRPDGHFPGTNVAALPPNTRSVGSWNNGDEWQGEATTDWMPVSRGMLRVYVAGYPQHPGCKLRTEFRHSDGSIEQVDCGIPAPHEEWKPWSFRSPSSAVAMRLVAWDHASDTCGWLAFSEPFATPFSWWAEWFMFGQVFTTLALALTLVWGPGLVWTPTRSAVEWRAAFVLGAGPLILVATGILIWLLDGVARPHHLGFIFVTALWAAIGIRFWRSPPAPGSGTTRILGIGALVVTAVVAKATYSGGPDGELYGGTISRTLAVGDRSDARISFCIVQMAAHHFAPSNPVAEGYFSPWTFFSRGPLAGLAALPISLATSGPPPLTLPDQPWQPFDTTGFAAYRIVLITLASMAVFALFATLATFVDETWAAIGAGLLALCPFGVHDIMFTWPKWEATAWTLLAFLLAHKRRPFVAGIALAIGFLFHPLAGLWAPWLAVWAAARHGPRPFAFLGAGCRFSAGLLILVMPWMVLGTLAPNLEGSTSGQFGFFNYFWMADGGPFHWASWCESRWENFANTFLPFWLHVFNENHPSIASVYGPIGPVEKFAFGWWNTLPLGLGLLLWSISLLAVAGAVKRLAAPVLCLLVGPALLLTAYWDAHDTGLMRECGHPLLAAIIGVTCVALARSRGRLASLVAHPLFPWLQLPETLLMLWLTTLLNPRPLAVAFGLLDRLYLTIDVLALVVAAWTLASVRKTSRPTFETAPR